MQAFEVLWLWWWFVLLLIGVTAAAFIYLGFYVPNLPGRPPGKEVPREHFPAGIEVTTRGIPPVLILLYVILLIYIIAYFVFVANPTVSF